MDTLNIRKRIMAEAGDDVEGVSGRWTLFTNLVNRGDFDQVSTPSMILAVDSIQETRLGIGRNFVSRKPIGERQMILSSQMAQHLKLLVGESLTLQYDLKLILNMAQRLSGEILPSFLTKSLSQNEL